jgi:hypothetical protein
MVDKAIIVEIKIKEMEKNGKRKTLFLGQSLGSNTQPRLPQSWPFFRNPSMVHPSMRSARTSRCRSLSHRLIDPVCSNRLTRTYRKALAQLLQPHRMHQLKCGLTDHFAWQCPTRQQFLEPEIRTSHKGSRISRMAR